MNMKKLAVIMGALLVTGALYSGDHDQVIRIEKKSDTSGVDPETPFFEQENRTRRMGRAEETLGGNFNPTEDLVAGNQAVYSEMTRAAKKNFYTILSLEDQVNKLEQENRDLQDALNAPAPQVPLQHKDCFDKKCPTRTSLRIAALAGIGVACGVLGGLVGYFIKSCDPCTS